MTRTQLDRAFAMLGALVIACFCLAWYYNTPDVINRLGATISAAGAAMVIYRVRREAVLADQDSEDSSAAKADNIAPINAELAQRVGAFRIHTRTEQRMNVVVYIAVVVCVGEILHGWGDKMYQLLDNCRLYVLSVF